MSLSMSPKACPHSPRTSRPELFARETRKREGMYVNA